MTEYVSEVKRIPHGDAAVFGVPPTPKPERVKEWLHDGWGRRLMAPFHSG